MQIIFTFTVNSDTKEHSFAGNIPLQVALPLLQEIIISEAVKQVTRQGVDKPAIIEDKKPKRKKTANEGDKAV